MIEIFLRDDRTMSEEALLGFLKEGWESVLVELQNRGVGEIASIGVVEISLLNDAEMGRIHGEFLDDATSTDVITFDHGELLIGIETALRQAETFQSHQISEIALYGIHGMLHLAGFDDQDAEDASAMKREQEALLAKHFPTIDEHRDQLFSSI